MADSELNYVQNPLVKVEGAMTPGEHVKAIIAGANAPDRLSFDPRDPEYDASWCRMVRGVGLVLGYDAEKQEDIVDWLDDVIGFDIPRHVVVQLVRKPVRRDASGIPLEEKGDYDFEPGGGGLRYKRRELEGHVTVKYGIPMDPPKEERRQAPR